MSLKGGLETSRRWDVGDHALVNIQWSIGIFNGSWLGVHCSVVGTMPISNFAREMVRLLELGIKRQIE